MSSPIDPATLELAGLYALGVLSDADAALVEAALATSAEMRKEVASYREVAAELMLAGPVVRPDPSLRTRLMDRVQREREQFHFSYADEGPWEQIADGVAQRRLFADDNAGRLIRLESGARHRAARESVEESYVVSGRIAIDGDALVAGDFRRMGAPATMEALEAPALLFSLAGGAHDPATGVTVRAGDGEWQPMSSGVSFKLLHRDRARGTQIMLMRMERGASLDEHAHGGAEELYMLSGECTARGMRLRSGDYHRAAAHSHHGLTTTEHGCVMLVVSRAA
jgi:quercetin dioxygenase-like cupin family protein